MQMRTCALKKDNLNIRIYGLIRIPFLYQFSYF